MHEKNNIEKNYNILRLIGFMQVSTVVFLLMVGVYFLHPPVSQSAEMMYVIYLLYSIAVLNFILIPFLRKKLMAMSEPRIQSEAALFKALITAGLISMSLTESTACYGIVIYIMSGDIKHLYTFCAIAMVQFILFFPRREEWQHYVYNIMRQREYKMTD